MGEYQCERCVNVEMDVTMGASGQIDPVRFCFLDRPEFPRAEACEDHEPAYSPIWGE